MREFWRRHGWLVLLALGLAAAAILTVARLERRPLEVDTAPPETVPMAGPSLPPVAVPSPSPSPASDEPSSLAEEAPATGIELGMKAPAFTAEALAGGTSSLSDYRGKVVLLDFWASWCGPCKASMPVLEGYAKRYADRGLVLLGLSVDRSPDAARQYLRENGYASLIPLWESPAASPTAAHTLYRIVGIPRTFLIDRDGIVRYAGHPAALTPAEIERWL